MISEHFSLAEFIFSEIAVRHGIDNTPTPEVLANLRSYTAPGLEQVRRLLKHPIYISSGYRSTLLNRKIRGSRKSAHVHGMAADFVCRGFGSPREVAYCIAESSIKFDQLIFEGSWVHIGFAPNPRMQLLTANFYAGSVTYLEGI